MYLSSVGSLKIKKSDNAVKGSSCACAFQADELNTCHSRDFKHAAFLDMRLRLKEQALISLFFQRMVRKKMVTLKGDFDVHHHLTNTCGNVGLIPQTLIIFPLSTYHRCSSERCQLNSQPSCIGRGFP